MTWRRYQRGMRVVLGAVACLAVARGIAAQAREGGAPQIQPLKGTLELKNFAHFAETDVDKRNYRGEVFLSLDWDQVVSSKVRARVVTWARGDTAWFSRGVDVRLPEETLHRSVVNLRQAVGSFVSGPIEVSVGKQIFAWGTADAYNPTDTLNPYDYLDVADNEKLGVLSAMARVTIARAEATVVLIPFFTPSRTPLADSRWIPLGIESAGPIIGRRDLPRRGLDTMQYATRVRTTVGGWDLSASYFNGFERTPVMMSTGVSLESPGVQRPRFTPVFTRIHAPGFDMSTTFGRFEFHGEGAFKLVERNGRHDVFQGIAGMNVAFDRSTTSSGCAGAIVCFDRATLLFEYAREAIVRTDPTSPIVASSRLFDIGIPVIDSTTGADNSPRDALIGQVLLRNEQGTELQVRATVNFKPTANHFAQVKLVRRLTDWVTVSGGFDFFTGETDTFWGRWGNNDRAFISTRFLF